MNSGDILAWTHRGWFKSWYDFKVMLVRLFQMSAYCHVGLFIKDDLGKGWVVEAVTSGVRKVPLTELPCYHLTGNGLTDAQRTLAYDLLSNPNMQYSQWEAILAFFGLNSTRNDQIECAELVTMVLGLPCKATPSAVVEYALSKGATLTEITT